MLSSIKNHKRQQKRNQCIELLFSEYDEKILKTKDDFNYEILLNLEPVQVDNIYHQMKFSKYNRLDTLNSPSNISKHHMRNISMKDLHKTKEFDTPSFSNIFTPRGKNLLNFGNLRKTPENVENFLLSPKQIDNQGQLSQRGFPKSRSQHTIAVDQIEEASCFEEMFQQKQLEIEDDNNEANANLPEFIQKEYTKRWGEVNVSIKKCDRHLQQEVSQTMKTINQNLKQIVQEQEQKRIIRNLTSLDSIFQVAKKEVIQLIDLTNDEKKQRLTKQYLQSSISKLPTIIPNTYTTQTEPTEYDELNKPSTNKFKKLCNTDPKFSYMYSRFIKKLHSPHLMQEALLQKKKVIRTLKPRQIYHPKKEQEILYQGLDEVLPNNNYDQKQEISIIKGQENSCYLPILQANKNSRAKVFNSNEQTLNTSSILDKSKLSTTINTSSYANLPRTVSTNQDHNNSRFSQFSPTKKNKPLNKSTSSKIFQKNKQQLPKFLVPFKDLVLNSWKGKIGPTAEENVLFSNCLGMLSLHREMTQSIPDIKEYQFNLDSQYTAVPSKSTRQQKNAEKKFKKVIKSNADIKQQLINLNIQQLDQIVEIEDPIDYLISDSY